MSAFALTGGIGSGKSTACQIFKELGATVISADKLVHQLLSPQEASYQAVLQAFGEKILKNDSKEIDRQTLKELIFNNIEAKALLESILHPAVRAKIKQLVMKKTDAPYTIVEIPLLKSKEDFPYLDGIIFIECKQDTQLERAANRDKLPQKLLESIVNSQHFLKKTKSFSDYLLNNDGEPEHLKCQIVALHQQLIEK